MDATEAARREAERIHQAAVADGVDPWNLLELVSREAARRDLDVYALATGESALKGGRAVLDRDAGAAEDVARLAGDVERRMQRQNQRTGFADAQTRTHVHAHGLQPGDFLQQLRGGEHHAIADVAGGPGPHDSTGNQVQRGFHTVDDQRVTGIVATLETHHGLGVIRQPVNDFALAFVAPLCADDYRISHGITCLKRRGRGGVLS